MARHKDILKRHYPEMLFTFDEETNYIDVSGNVASGFYLDENIFQNMATANIYRMNNDSYVSSYNTKTVIPNERFSTFTSFSFGKTVTEMAVNKSDLFLDVEVDPECTTSMTDNFSTSFQLQFPELKSNNTLYNTQINNEAFKRYQLLMVRIKDNLILGRGEYSFNKNVVKMTINPNLLFNRDLKDENNEVIPQMVEVAFLLIYDRFAYTDTKSVFRDNEWNYTGSNKEDKINRFYNDSVGSYLYLDANPMHDINDFEIQPTDLASWVKYNTSSYNNLPQTKLGVVPYTHIWTMNVFKFRYDPKHIPVGIDNKPQQITRLPDYDFDGWHVNVLNMCSSSNSSNTSPEFKQYEYLEYPDYTDDIIKTWSDITLSSIEFNVALNKIPHIVKFNTVSTSTTNSLWYQIFKLNNFRIYGKPVGSSIHIAIVINGIVMSGATYTISNNITYNFVVNYDRSNSNNKLELYVNGELAKTYVISNVDQQFIGQLIKDENNSIQIGIDGITQPYMFTTNVSYNWFNYTTLPSSTWGQIITNQTETGYVNIFPTRVLVDNFAVFNNKLFTIDEARELFISTLTYSGILTHLGITNHYEFKSLKHYYRYVTSNFNYADGWVYKLIDSRTYNDATSSSSTTSNDMYYDSVSLMYSGDVSIEDVSDHGIIQNALRMQNNAILQTRNNLISNGTSEQTAIFWFKTSSNKHQYILSAVDHRLPYKGASVEIQSGYITFNFGATTITTPNSYADGEWHRMVIQYRPYIGQSKGLIRYELDENFKHEYAIDNTLVYTHDDYTQYWKMNIGNDLIGDKGFDGYFAEFQIFSKYINEYYLKYLYNNRQFFVTNGVVYFNNLPTNTKVRVYSHLTGELLAQLYTDENGFFEYKNEETYTIDVVVLDNRNYMEYYQTFTGVILNSK